MMTTREFVQHLLLNCELDDPVMIEVKIPDDSAKLGRYLSFEPKHASRIGETSDEFETLIECKPYKGDN